MNNKFFYRHIELWGILLCAMMLSSSGRSLYSQPLTENECTVISTFSIVGRDSVTGELGVAVASRFFAVGSVVPWSKAEIEQ